MAEDDALCKILAVWTRVLDGESDSVPVSSTSTALEKVRVVKIGECVLLGFSGLSTNVAQQFIQVFNTNTPALTAGQVPVMVISVAAGANFSVSFSTWGRHMTQGCVIANSTTAATYTAGANDTWFDAQYL